MSKEKQIENNELQEFVITLSDCQHIYDKECTKAIVTKAGMPKTNKFYAKYLMEHGYRKPSDVVVEVISEAENYISFRREYAENQLSTAKRGDLCVDSVSYYEGRIDSYSECLDMLAELKKKYTEGRQ